MRARVVLAWRVMYPDPIDVRAGETIVVGHADPEWPGWRWCSDARGRSGWVPDELIDEHEPAARIRQDYTARELEAAEGDEVVIEREMAGWAWCRANNGACGWLPAQNVVKNVDR